MSKFTCRSTAFSSTSQRYAAMEGPDAAPWRGARMRVDVRLKCLVTRTVRIWRRRLSSVHARMLSQRWVGVTGMVLVAPVVVVVVVVVIGRGGGGRAGR